MKAKYLLILFLNIGIAQAQQIHLQGSIVDSQSGLRVAKATISVQSKRLFYRADGAGKFEVTSNELVTIDSVGFSCIGYETQKIKARDMKRGIIIKLSPMVNMLHEVKIGVDGPVLIKVGSKEKNNNYMSTTYHTGSDMAEFMEGSKNIKGVIQTVSFYLSNGRRALKGGDVTAPFRIRVFAVDTNSAPGEELTKDVIVVSGRKNNAWFDVDISAYHIQNPDSGFFVAFGLLNLEYYKLRKGAKTTDEFGQPWETIDTLGVRHVLGTRIPADVIAPRLGVTSGGFKNPRAYFSCTTSQNMSWHWEKDYFNRRYLIRATIAPE
jgi:hypothetical protein